MAKLRDMTTGSPIRHILTFAVPILFGNVFQQLYSLVDTAVVGKVVGTTALAAVGSAGWLDWLVLGFVIGLTQGFGILIAQRFGAGDYPGMRRAAATSAWLAALIALVMTALSLSMAGIVLRWMNTPAGETYTLARAYVRVIFMGIPVTVTYNLTAAMLRALGDSRTPLFAMIAAALLNIGLDFLFVASFGWGVAGAAGATVTAQACSALICFIAVMRVDALRPQKGERAPDRATAKQLLRLGLPIAGQNIIVSAGGLVLQTIVNGFGVVFMAGVTAAMKLSGILEIVGLSISSAMHTFAGQNLGAKKYARIREGVRKAVLLAVGLALVVGAAGILFGRPMIRLFVDLTSENAARVVEYGYDFFVYLCAGLFLLYALFIFRSTLQGMGDAVFPVLSAFLQVFMRTAFCYFITSLIGEHGVYISDVAAWASAGLMLMLVCRARLNRLDARACAPSGGAA